MATLTDEEKEKKGLTRQISTMNKKIKALRTKLRGQKADTVQELATALFGPKAGKAVRVALNVRLNGIPLDYEDVDEATNFVPVRQVRELIKKLPKFKGD